MEWLGLDWDEGPFYQADGLERHRAHALQLLERGYAYRCFCTPDELQERREAARGRQEAYRYDRTCTPTAPPEAAEASAAARQPVTLARHMPEGQPARK